MIVMLVSVELSAKPSDKAPFFFPPKQWRVIVP